VELCPTSFRLYGSLELSPDEHRAAGQCAQLAEMNLGRLRPQGLSRTRVTHPADASGMPKAHPRNGFGAPTPHAELDQNTHAIHVRRDKVVVKREVVWTFWISPQLGS
jgi:hypothetical protein